MTLHELGESYYSQAEVLHERIRELKARPDARDTEASCRISLLESEMRYLREIGAYLVNY